MILLNTLRSCVVGRQGFGKVVVVVHQQFTQVARSAFNIRGGIQGVRYPQPGGSPWH